MTNDTAELLEAANDRAILRCKWEGRAYLRGALILVAAASLPVFTSSCSADDGGPAHESADAGDGADTGDR